MRNLIKDLRRVYRESRFESFVRANGIVVPKSGEYTTRSEDLTTFHFGFSNSVESYAFNIASYLVQAPSFDEVLRRPQRFEKLASNFLSKSEISLILKNIRLGNDPVWGIALLEDRAFLVEPLVRMYDSAKAVAGSERLLGENARYLPPFVDGSHLNSLSRDVENHPIYKAVKGDAIAIAA